MIYADRVKESSTSTGLGNIILAGTLTGFRTFASIISIGESFYYCIDGGTSGEWEVGIGVLTDATTLVRSSVLSSSNADAAVSFSAGAKTVFVTIAADGISAPAAMQTSLSSIDELMNQTTHLLERLMFLTALQTPTSELRVNVNAGTLPTVTTVSTVSSVTSVANQVNGGGYALSHQVMALMNQGVAGAIRPNISVS
ncbi:MAG TPA: hypothetical protein PLH72_16655 [Vicinamibacterales bacterium]|nr:hypothetical protein [Vicinamibacterales bacterium]